MRRTFISLLLVAPLAAVASGCSKWFQRPERYDPFASARRTPDDERAAMDYPKLVPAGRGDEVTQAANETNTRHSTAERHPPLAADAKMSPYETAGSEDDSIESAALPRMATRPAIGRVLDHAPDYSWIQGQLEYSALCGGVWKVRYAPLSADDQYGGSMILESPPSIKEVRAGDVVYVEGRIIAQSARGPLPNPIYRAEHMSKAN